MYRLLISIFAAVACLFAGYAAEVARVTVNGEPVSKTVTAISFNGDQLTLHFGDSDSMDSDMDKVSLAFVDDATSSLGELAGGLSVFTYEGIVGDVLTVSGLQPGSALRVLDLSGRTVFGPVATESRMEINVSDLSAGVYVLCAGKDVVKFTKH